MKQIQIIKQEFCRELYRRINLLRDIGYNKNKIIELFEYSSLIEEYQKILISSGLEGKIKNELKSFLKEALSLLYKKKLGGDKINHELSEKNNNIVKELKKTLDEYTKTLYWDYSGLGKIKMKEREKEVIEYFGLLPKSPDKTLIPIEYRKIMIVSYKNKFNVFATKKHLSEQYEKVENIQKFLKNLKDSIKKIKKERDKLTEFEKIKSFTIFLYKSMYILARDLAIYDIQYEKVIKKLTNEDTLGKTYSENDSFSYLSQISNEKEIQTKEILKIVSKLKKKGLYLDYGAGAGDICFKIGKKFKKSIFIEPGEKMIPFLQKKEKENNIDCKIMKITGEDFLKNYFALYKNKFDLITSVHSIYYFKDICKGISQLMNLLSPEGKLIIVLGVPDKKSFTNKYREKYLSRSKDREPMDNIIQRCFPKIKPKKINVTLALKNLDKLFGNPERYKSLPINYYFKFRLKSFIGEMSEEQLNDVKDHFEKDIDKEGNYKSVGLNYVYVFEKGELK